MKKENKQKNEIQRKNRCYHYISLYIIDDKCYCLGTQLSLADIFRKRCIIFFTVPHSVIKMYKSPPSIVLIHSWVNCSQVCS